jgi:hypothetical protein
MELPCTKAGNIGASRVQLNPAWIMFAIAAFGYLFGVVIRLAIRQYMESRLRRRMRPHRLSHRKKLFLRASIG